MYFQCSCSIFSLVFSFCCLSFSSSWRLISFCCDLYMRQFMAKRNSFVVGNCQKIKKEKTFQISHVFRMNEHTLCIWASNFKWSESCVLSKPVTKVWDFVYFLCDFQNVREQRQKITSVDILRSSLFLFSFNRFIERQTTEK